MRGAVQTVTIMVLVGDKPTWWQVDATGSWLLDTVPTGPVKTVYRAAPYDRCLAQGRVSGDKRNRLVMQELGERGVAFRDRELTFFTPEVEALCGPSERVCPLAVVIARWRAQSHAPLPSTLVIRLGADTEESLAVIWPIGLDEAPMTAATAIGADETSLRESARDAADRAGLTDAGPPVVLSHADFWGALTAGAMPFYPVPGTWHGVSTQVLRWTILGTAMAAAGLSGLWDLSAHADSHKARQHLTQAVARVQRTTRRTAFDQRHVLGIAHAGFVPFATGVRAAQSLWRPGTLVGMRLGPDPTTVMSPPDHPRKIVITVHARMHHIQGQAIGAEGIWPAQQALARLVHQSPPPGYVIRRVSVNPHGSRYAVIYQSH